MFRQFTTLLWRNPTCSTSSAVVTRSPPPPLPSTIDPLTSSPDCMSTFVTRRRLPYVPPAAGLP